MNRDNSQPTAGWTPLKVIGMIIGVLGMLGFGVCSLCGLFIGIGGTDFVTVVPFVLVGLLLTALFLWLIRAILRNVHGHR